VTPIVALLVYPRRAAAPAPALIASYPGTSLPDQIRVEEKFTLDTVVNWLGNSIRNLPARWYPIRLPVMYSPGHIKLVIQSRKSEGGHLAGQKHASQKASDFGRYQL
jgi:hypothetical protein